MSYVAKKSADVENVKMSVDAKHFPLRVRSRVCTVVHYAVLEVICAAYGIWQI